MYFFKYTPIMLLIGISATNADSLIDDLEEESSLSQAVNPLDDVAAYAANTAVKLTGEIRDKVKDVNVKLNNTLKTFRKTVGSRIKESVSSVADSTADDVPECMVDIEKQAGKLVASTVEEVGKCVSSPFISIMQDVEELTVAANKASKAAKSFVKHIEDCNEELGKVYCLTKVLHDAQETAKEIAITTVAKAESISATIASLETNITTCAAFKLFFGSIKAIGLTIDAVKCNTPFVDVNDVI